MSQKITFVENRLQATANSLAQAIDALRDAETVYFDRGYNSGGSNPITDADISALGVTAANVASMITLAQQLIKFADNLAVTQGDYDSTLNVMRTDV